MQARAGLARALAVRPEILLMDEPFSHVDEITARNLRRELQALCEDTKPTVIFVTHNPREAVFLADRIYVLSGLPACVRDTIDVPMPRPRLVDSEQMAAIVQDVYNILDT